MGKFARQFEPLYRKWRGSIFEFIRAFNFEPTDQQAGLLKLVQNAADGTGSKWIACKSGQGPGKTTISVFIGLWRAIRAIDAMTVVSAPTMRQVKDVWLAEARRRMETAHPLLKRFIDVTKSKVVIGNRPDWGVKTVTATRPENAQGLHQDNMSVILEEASGIPRELVEQFKGTLTNEDQLFLLIGNPNTRDCSFFDCFNSQRHLWDCLTFNAEDSPIVAAANIARLEDEFGRDSDVFRIRVLGEFPFSDPNCVMSSEELEKVMVKALLYKMALIKRRLGSKYAAAKQFGLDFARFGGDENVIYRRQGEALVEFGFWPHTDPNDVVDKAFAMQAEAGWSNNDTWYVPDAGGMGQGVMKNFSRASKKHIEFHNEGRPGDKQYANRITEAWFQLARKARRVACYLPRDPRLIQQLSTRQYYTTRKGQLILETKDEYMKRGHTSPDRADGAVLAMYDELMATSRISGADSSRRVGSSAA
ncbi:MAG: hypothetical protein GY906_13065 [bacterium]|nr:hypothetical protein [bacterium]